VNSLLAASLIPQTTSSTTLSQEFPPTCHLSHNRHLFTQPLSPYHRVQYSPLHLRTDTPAPVSNPLAGMGAAMGYRNDSPAQVINSVDQLYAETVKCKQLKPFEFHGTSLFHINPPLIKITLMQSSLDLHIALLSTWEQV